MSDEEAEQCDSETLLVQRHRKERKELQGIRIPFIEYEDHIM